jgi:homoserine dehydrogenase
MSVADRAGVLAQIASVFAGQEVSIASMLQKGRGDEAELVLITHPTKEKHFFTAIGQAKNLACCRNEPITLRVL